jgi:alpha-mannosidase
VLRDASDTWSHGIPSFEGPADGAFRVERCFVEESGPIRACLRVEATHGRSRLALRARLYAGSPVVDVEVELSWMAEMRIAKLALALAEEPREREDGIPGGSIRRAMDGHENPLVDWTLTPGGCAVAAPDCFALDGRNGELRLTLVRSPVYAWHDPTRLSPYEAYRYTDQGEHLFRFRVLADATAADAADAAAALHDPPVCLDWTKGIRR